MSNSITSSRMSEANPKVIFFYTSKDKDNWRNCFSLKAATVYSAITGIEVKKETMASANELLINIAWKCYYLIPRQGKVAGDPPSSDKAPNIDEISQEKGDKQNAEGTQGAATTTGATTTGATGVAATGAAATGAAATGAAATGAAATGTAATGTAATGAAATGAAATGAAATGAATTGAAATGATTTGATTTTEAAKNKDPNDYYPTLKELIDGIYLVVGFLPKLNDAAENWDRQKANDQYISTHNEDVITDIIKIENQIPMKTIENVVKFVGKAITKCNPSFNFKSENFKETVDAFCWYYSPFYSKERIPASVSNLVFGKNNLLDCLHYSITRRNNLDDDINITTWKIPSAKQLKRSGIRFQAQLQGYVNVSFSNDSTFCVPALMYDFKLETVVKNLLDFESSSAKKQKPVTRYFQFLSELVNDVGDVKLMKKVGVLTGSWKNLHEVHDLVKRIGSRASTSRSVCFELDGEIKKARKFHEEKMKKFLVRNKPAVLWVSSVAAASVLFTAVWARRRRSN